MYGSETKTSISWSCLPPAMIALGNQHRVVSGTTCQIEPLCVGCLLYNHRQEGIVTGRCHPNATAAIIPVACAHVEVVLVDGRTR